MVESKAFWDWAEDENYDVGVPDEPYEVPEEAPDSHAWHPDARKHRAELYLNQEELYKTRLDRMNATDAERIAAEQGAYAVIEYRTNGKVAKTAMEYVEEVIPVADNKGIKRRVALCNVIVPWARHLQSG